MRNAALQTMVSHWRVLKRFRKMSAAVVLRWLQGGKTEVKGSVAQVKRRTWGGARTAVASRRGKEARKAAVILTEDLATDLGNE